MFFVNYISFILKELPYVIINDFRLKKNFIAVVVPNFLAYYVNLFLKYSAFFKKVMLYDIGGYDIPFITADNTLSMRKTFSYTPILWYLFKNIKNDKFFLFSLPTGANGIKQASVETLFRNARWLEREAGEFFGFFFTNKADRRCLFTIPLFYNFPLRKKYPTQGFYEVFFCPILKKIQFKLTSALS